MRIAIILGSIRTGRQSHKIAYYLQNQLQHRDIQVEMIDLLYNQLPLMEERIGRNAAHPAVVDEVGKKLKQADAFILVTPEYHGSYSGVLKNMLDYYWAEFSKKPVGVVTTAGGKMGGINASIQLQHLVLSMGSFPLPVKLLVPEIQHAFDDSFNPQNETVVKATDRFLNEFLWFAGAITAARQQVMA
jgi:azobenzene reductase